MTVDVTTLRTRRSLLAAALGAVGAFAAGAIARPDRVSAHDADDIRLGGNTLQDETGVTAIRNLASDTGGMSVDAAGGGYGLAATYRGPGPTGFAIQGFSYQTTGVEGYANASGQTGVRGRARGGTGVLGFSGAASATLPAVHPKTGVFGVASQDASAIGVLGQSATGRGGVFSGKVAHLRLPPSSAATHPHAGQPGDVFVDSSYRLWFCKGGASWVKLA